MKFQSIILILLFSTPPPPPLTPSAAKRQKETFQSWEIYECFMVSDCEKLSFQPPFSYRQE